MGFRDLEQKGQEALRRAGNDPIGRFLIRVISPGVRREIARLKRNVSNVVDEFTDSLKSAERDDEDDEGSSSRDTKRKPEVIDAEIIDEQRRDRVRG